MSPGAAPHGPEFSRGLEGVTAAATRIGFVDGRAGRLVYRGYDACELARRATFEETAYLLLHGDLPRRRELEAFSRRLRAERPLPAGVVERISGLPCPCHPMSLLRTGLSLLECMGPACPSDRSGDPLEEAVRLIARTATLVAQIGRHLQGLPPVEPRSDLEHGANFLYMLRGERADPLEEEIMEAALVLHADHGMNASTFAAMVAASTLTDMTSALTAAVAALKGPLHGGANEAVLRGLLTLETPEQAAAYVEGALASGERIMGFGHRVYKTYDPRARVLAVYAEELCRRTGNTRLLEAARVVERAVVAAYGSRGIFPNVDFYSGIVYHCLGIAPSLFTPVFAVSRAAGWTARILEYTAENRLFRPRAVYAGPKDRRFRPLEERG